MSVVRLSVDADAVTVEAWRDWAAFDEALPAAHGLWCDIAAPVGTPSLGASARGGVVELQRVRAQNGHLADVARLLGQDAEVWSAAGAVVLGIFQVMHGDDLPACLLLMRWPTLAAALDAKPGVERHPDWIAARRVLREARGISVIRGTRRVFRSSLVLSGSMA